MRKLCKASVRPNPFLNLNSNCKKIPLSSPPNICPFVPLHSPKRLPLCSPPPEHHPPEHQTPPSELTTPPPSEPTTPPPPEPTPPPPPPPLNPPGRGVVVNGQTLGM